jgi:aquaporin NIP
MRKYVAEFIGTFAIVFVGCGTCIAHHAFSPDITHVGVAIAFGTVVMCMVYALGKISGAHFNPAVTLAFATVHRFPVRHIIPYFLSQFAGAIAASAVHIATYGTAMTSAASFGATVPSLPSNLLTLLMEGILTFFLMFVIIAVATDCKVPSGISGLAIGATVCFGCLAAGKCCGASMNPARSLGPALFAGKDAIAVLWLYICAPPIGAVLAAAVYEWIRGPRDRVRSVPDFESTDEQIGEGDETANP